MRTAPDSSADTSAPADFPSLRDKIVSWQAALAQTDWIPWIIIGIAAFLRLFLLAIKPPHFDEGINGWFVDAHIIKEGFYKYDPTNYHGPLHFYVLFLFQTLFGRSLWALRLPVVIVSTLCVWLTFKFEPFVGRNTARIAALAMAVSPGFVFYGRYSIHEVWLVLFGMMFILGLLGLRKFGTADYLWATGMGLAGMILTKETYLIHLGCAFIALGLAWISGFVHEISERQRRSLTIVLSACSFVAFFLPWIKAPASTGLASIAAVPHGFLILAVPILAAAAATLALLRTGNRTVSWISGCVSLAAIVYVASICDAPGNPLRIGGYLTILAGGALIFLAASPSNPSLVNETTAAQKWSAVDLAMVFGVGAALIVFFYSGTFFYWDGVKGLYQCFEAWFATGNEGHGHEKPWFYWLQLIAPSFDRSRADFLGYELPALIGLVFSVFVLRFKNFSLRFLAIYGVGVFAAYSIVNYKTPWCIINIIWPFLFILGAATLTIPEKIRETYRGAINSVYAVLLTLSLGSTVWLNYFHCTTDTEPYVYVQTYNDINKIVRPVMHLAKQDPIFYQMTGNIIRTSSYPLPWIFDDFPHVGYYEHDNLPPEMDADFLLVQQDKIETVESKLKQSYFTDTMTIRSYQEPSKIYFNTKLFRDVFPNRKPDFVGQPKG